MQWSHTLEQMKTASRNALNNWRISGCPVNGHLKEELVKVRREYKKAIKAAKINCKTIKANRLRQSLQNRNSKKFWGVVNGGKVRLLGSKGSVDVQSFASSFKNNFIDSADNTVAVKNYLLASCMKNDSVDILFNVEEIEKALAELNSSVALDCDNLNVFHLKYAHPAIFTALNRLFNKMTQCGVIPNKFGNSVITPVVKNASRSLSEVCNFRPVSIISIIAKIFESLISLRFGHLFSSHANQFGFCAEVGCNKAIFAFNNTVRYFRDKNSNVYICALDITKAFDRLNHFSLFQCLLEHELPTQLVELFFCWYRNMHACVKWEGKKSEFLDVLSGCPQGSVLGPKFFSRGMDMLLLDLDHSGLGCRIGRCYAGSLAYADDIILMLSSVSHLRLMLHLSYNFGIAHDLLLNTNKFFCGMVGYRLDNILPAFNLGASLIQRTETIVYLGVTFKLGSSLTVDFSERCKKFLLCVCGVLRHKVDGYEVVFSNILVKKCLSILNYVLECIYLDSASFNTLNKSWNMALRWLFN